MVFVTDRRAADLCHRWRTGTRMSRSKVFCRFIIGILPLVIGCRSDDQPETLLSRPLPTLQLTAESPAPFSGTYAITLLSDHRACAIASYEVEVRCGDRDGTAVTVLGGRGEGPGEFKGLLSIVRGPDGEFGIVDPIQGRITIYDAPGNFLRTVRLPFIFESLGPFDSTLVGSFTASGEPGERIAVISAYDGAVLETLMPPHPIDLGLMPEGRRGLSWGAMAPNGDLAFVAAGPTVVQYSRSGELREVHPAVGHRPEFPSRRDIDAHVESYANSIFGAAPAHVIDKFAVTEKSYALGGASMRFDEVGRLWVATQKDRDLHSYIDVYDGSRFVGSVQVRDRMLGFDLLGSTLVVLVERSGVDAEGLPRRAIDWYSTDMVGGK